MVANAKADFDRLCRDDLDDQIAGMPEQWQGTGGTAFSTSTRPGGEADRHRRARSTTSRPSLISTERDNVNTDEAGRDNTDQTTAARRRPDQPLTGHDQDQGDRHDS